MAKRYDRGTVAGESKRSFLQFPRGIVFSRNAVSSESRTVLKRHSLHVKEANSLHTCVHPMRTMLRCFFFG